MTTARTQWLIAQRMKSTRPRVTLHVAVVNSVTVDGAMVYLNGNTEEEVGPVETVPGLTLTAGQVVDVTFTGDAPLITARRT